MEQSGYAIPWPKSLATELQALGRQRYDLKIRRQHAIEIIAACFGKVSASLLPDGVLATEGPAVPEEVPWQHVRQRLRKLDPNLSAQDIENIQKILTQIWGEESTPILAFAKRLTRNIATNCQHHGNGIYSGSVLLTEADWRQCHEVVADHSFQDHLAEPLPWPSIVPIGMARREPIYEDRYQVEPGCILNVLAFLCQESWEDLLARYRK